MGEIFICPFIPEKGNKVICKNEIRKSIHFDGEEKLSFFSSKCFNKYFSVNICTVPT